MEYTLEGLTVAIKVLKRIAGQMDRMRKGDGLYYVFRYLGAIGFLPGYAFPDNAIALTYDAGSEERKIIRSRVLSLREFAPYNNVYVAGGSYRVIEGNIFTESNSGIATFIGIIGLLLIATSKFRLLK